MRFVRWSSIAAAIAVGCAMPPAAAAQSISVIGCGSFRNYNISYQYGSYAWLEYIVETSRDVNVCPYAVAVEGWVIGHPGGSQASASGLFSASVRRPVLLPNYGDLHPQLREAQTWTTAGKHWRILLTEWYSNGNTASVAVVRAPAADPASQCSLLGAEYYWNGFECVYTPGSPIIVDTARDGYNLTSVDEGVPFDLDADGTAEQIAWTRPGSDDAFLAMDRNGNGRIDDGSELFGNYTPAHANGAEPRTLNGFEALRSLHTPDFGRSTLDHHIDAGDDAFHSLLLWRDVNHDGVSEADELTPASTLVAAFGTEYREKKRIDRFGNQFRQQGRLTWTTGEDGIVYDVWLRRRE